MTDNVPYGARKSRGGWRTCACARRTQHAVRDRESETSEPIYSYYYVMNIYGEPIYSCCEFVSSRGTHANSRFKREFESIHIIWGATIKLTGRRPVRAVKDPSHEPVPSPVQHEKNPSREAEQNSFLILVFNQRAESKWLADPAHQKREEDTADEVRMERSSCLVLNISIRVSRVASVKQT